MNKAWWCFAGQAAGMGVIIWRLLPIYRALVESVPEASVPTPVLASAVGSVLMIQVCYWVRLKRLPPWSLPDLPLLGHAVIFTSRLSFIMAGGTFSTVFIVRFPQVHFEPGRGLLLIAVIFSMFCFTQEAERLGQALVKPMLDRAAMLPK